MFVTRKDLALSPSSGESPRLPCFASLSFVGSAARAHPGFASLSMSAVPGQKKKNDVDSQFGKTVQEAATGLEFTREYCTRGKTSNCSKVAGLGVRAKRILGMKNINIYAVGLYVDAPAIKSKLSKYKGQSAETLSTSKQFYKDFIAEDNVEKTVRLMMSYGGITSTTFWNALKERLEAPLAKAGEKETLVKFGAQFDDVKFSKGMDIAFTCLGNTTVTCIDGKEVGKIKSAALNKALLGVYVGDSPVSETAKVNFGLGLAGLLAE